MERMVFISHSTADREIANAICHRLEEAGVRCWIAPRDITHGDWAGSIMDGLRRSEVYVIVVSRNSIESPEVTKEVTEATHTCRYILPFKVDDNMLSDRLQYHLGPCHWLDAVTPPLEARIDELLQHILNLSSEDGSVLSGPDIISRGFVYMKDNEDLMDAMKMIATHSLEVCHNRNISDWATIKSTIKGDLSQFLFKNTKRNPMILPVIMEI